MDSLTFPVSHQIGQRICRALVAKLGQPESSSASDRGKWVSECSFRFRRDDGSVWSRLGSGPTRKMVTLRSVDGQYTRCWVQPCK